MLTNIANEDYRARYQAIQAIEDACIRSEKGEKIDLRDTAKKISELMQQLNKDAKAIHGKTGVSIDVRKAHDHCMKNLTSLDARVKALSVGGSKFSTRMNSICNVALIIAGIGAMIAIGNKAFSAASLASEKSPITNVILPKMTADHLALYAKWAAFDSGRWMIKLENLWRLNGDEGFFSKDDQFFIRNAYHLARKEAPESERLLMDAVLLSLSVPDLSLSVPNEVLAKLGDSSSMYALEAKWRSGLFPISEDEKSAIRKTYDLAIKKLIMEGAFLDSRSFEERAKNGDQMSMLYLKDLWQSNKGDGISETDQSSIENAYHFAYYGKLAVVGSSDAMRSLGSRWRKDSRGSISESYKDLVRDGYHAEVEMRQKEYEEFAVHNKGSYYWMNLLEELWLIQGAEWQGRGTCVSEDHKSSTRNAFNLANNIKEGCNFFCNVIATQEAAQSNLGLRQ